jgi:hypothetical protein
VKAATDRLILYGALAAGAYLLWKKISPGIAAATSGVSSAIAATYEALTFGPPIQAVGNVDDLSGRLLGPIASYPQATDSQGNTYLQIGGATYQLGPRDANGNFTAIPVPSVAAG